MSLDHNSSSIHHFLKNKEMNEMYLSYGIFNFALGLISVFIPIYFYQLGYSISAILFFFLLNSLGFLAFSYIGTKIISKLGVKHSLLLTVPVFIIFFIGLRFIETYPFLFFILPFLRSFKMILYNYSFHLNFIQHSNKKRRGREVSLLQTSGLIASTLSPFIGGIIIKYAGFTALFVVGSVILFFAVIPLFMSKDSYEKVTFSQKNIFRDIFKKENLSLAYSFSGYAIESWIGMILWPIFLLLMMFSTETIGAITSLTALMTFLTFYFVGQATDKRDKRDLLRLGTFLYFFGWIGRIFVTGLTSILFIDTYKNITYHMVTIPWSAYSYDIAAKRNYFKFIVQREIIFNLSRSLVLPILMFLFFLSSSYYIFIISFIIAAFSSLLYVSLNNETA